MPIMRPRKFRWLAIATRVLIFAVLPGVYQNHLLLFNFVIFLILAQGVNIIYGFTGYLPFGYVGFFGAGAYGFAILVMHYQSPAIPAVLVAGVVGVALGLLLTPLLRLSGAYFAIANLARKLDIEPETALRRATAKFERRFRGVETLAAERGIGPDLDALEALWQEVKRQGG